MNMPSGPFAHVCMLVKDLDKAIEDWTKILGVLDPASLEKRIVKYDEFSSGEDQGMKWATFVNDHSTEIQFIQPGRSEEHTSELQSLMRNSYAVFCLKKKIKKKIR